MKRFLIPLFAALALPTAINANVDPEVAEICMKAADFKGCVEIMSSDSKKSRIKNLTSSEQKLLDEIVKLPNRITRTSLINFQTSVRDFADAVSIAEYENPNSELVLNAQKLLLSFDILYKEWQQDIDSGNNKIRSYKKNLVVKNKLDSLFGGNTFAIRCSEVKGLFGWDKDYSDPISEQVFYVVHTASKQLANEGSYRFPSMSEEPLIPLQIAIDARYKSSGTYAGNTLGMAQRLCGTESKKVKKEEPEKKEKKTVKINCNSPVWKKKPICN